MRQTRFPGELIRLGREAAGLSLHDVHDHVHVPVQYLRAIEEGRLDALPIPTYTIGFLNSYCQFIGLDPEPFVDQYRACAQPPAGSRFRSAASATPRPRPRWVGDLIAWGAVCAFLLLGWFTYSVIVRPVAQNAPTRVDAGTIEAPKPPQAHLDEGF